MEKLRTIAAKFFSNAHFSLYTTTLEEMLNRLLTLVKGRSLFIYELKRLELKAPAEGNPGEKLDLRWPEGQEKARGVRALDQEQRRTRGRSQQEER